jgi:hypothetical protein
VHAFTTHMHVLTMLDIRQKVHGPRFVENLKCLDYQLLLLSNIMFCITIFTHGYLYWVKWIDATVIFTYLRNATVIFNFGKMPLQFCVCLRNAITPT